MTARIPHQLAKRGRTGLVPAATLAILVGLCTLAYADDDVGVTPESDWSEAAIDSWSKVPVLDEGRVKPLYTWANYALLRLNHRRTCHTPAGRKLDPVEWILDVFFRPDLARTYRCFRVDTDEITTAIGVDVEGRAKADRYSFDELMLGAKKLFELSFQYRNRKTELTPVEADIVKLAQNVRALGSLLRFFDFARTGTDLSSVPGLPERPDDGTHVPYSEILALAAELRQSTEGRKLLEGAVENAGGSSWLDLLPPTEAQATQLELLHEEGTALSVNPEVWLSPWSAGNRALGKPATGERALADEAWDVPPLRAAERHVEMIALLEAMHAARDNAKAFATHAAGFLEMGRERAEQLDLYGSVELEVTYHHLDLFRKAQWIYVLAFLLMAISWLGLARGMIPATWVLVGLATALVVTGLVLRCVIMERPPVATLYETIVFIAAFAVLSALILERLSPRRIALAFAPVLGAAGLILAERYEVMKTADTMSQLPAVLDTNFWLTLHVIAISIGYAACLIAAVVGHVYVLGKVFGAKRDDKAFYRDVNRMAYGSLTFALIFTTVGTILGGIWGTEAWGRFWGWDPKENGALIIVLWQLVMVHARLGGFLKPFGFSMACVFLTMVLAFSWFGVNLLGIGLHTYGFTAGIQTVLAIVYWGETGILLTGFVWWLVQRHKTMTANLDTTS